MRKLFLSALLACLAASAADFRSGWPPGAERPWPGPEYWSNPLQDWRVRAGRLECFVAGQDRNVFLLTREVSPRAGKLAMSVLLGRLEEDKGALKEGFAGFRLGVRGQFQDYRDSAVRGVGMNAGLSMDGRLFIGESRQPSPGVPPPFTAVELRLAAEPAGAAYKVRLEAYDKSGKLLSGMERPDIQPAWLTGGIALVCHSGQFRGVLQAEEASLDPAAPGTEGKARGGTVRFWFRDWKVSGDKVDAHEDRTFGPILWAMHTLSRRVLKMTAQMAPVGNAPRQVSLEIRESAQGIWRRVATAQIDALSRTATFRLPNWNDGRDIPYRVSYTMPDASGRPHEYTFAGMVRKDPAAKPKIVVAAFTGNNDMGFPHADIVRHVKAHRPDFLAYTGDNIYERVGGYGIQRAPLETAALDYLRKWYLFGWEYREMLKEIPAVCLPDDHDVYHGNLWGAGGRRSWGEGYEGQDRGGYVMPAEWVKAVERTQTSHHPDPFDPTPVEQGIGVYYGPLLYGGVSFAVLEDRKFKSPPKEMLPKAQIINGWAQSETYNPAKEGDVPGAELLGRRQEDFLSLWAVDWSGGAWMKVVISQTLFANVATLPKGSRADNITPKLKVMAPGEYAENEEPVADHDSNGWPQTPRNRALRAMRKGLAFHIAGDQHLGSTIQYGMDDWNDAAWALCVPSVANVWPRRWYPPQPGANRRPGSPKYTGEFLDGFGNKITVHAISNPAAVAVEPVAITHRAPGYGIVAFDRATRKITIANWPRWVDPPAQGAKPYEGWPITIGQLDNGYPRGGLSLGKVEAPHMKDPVVQVTDQASGEIIYAFRIMGSGFEPRVRKPGLYTVKLVDPDQKTEKVFKDRRAAKE